MKKQSQLGMNPSTASHRLVKDVLFKFVQLHHPNCYKCGKPLTRDTFSIEHKTPWLDSDDPVGLYFDLDNIDFSHLACNVGGRRKEPARHGTASKYSSGCRCAECTAAIAKAHRDSYTPERRKAKYLRTGT